MTPITPRRQTFIRLGFAFALMFIWGLSAFAQQGDASQYDRGTPPQHAAGVSPLSSYLSTDLGVTNLSNGALNIKLPFGQIGGRGFWVPFSLDYASKIWSATKGEEFVIDPFPGHSAQVVFAVYDDPANALDLYNRVAPGWTIGGAPILRARGLGIASSTGGSCPASLFNFSRVLVKLTLVLPDKGEIQLRDDQTDGAPLSSQLDSDGCRTIDGYRGRRWHATDGSGIIFIGDNDNGVIHGDLAGTVILPDGTRYRFNDPSGPSTVGSAYVSKLVRCSSITDRNGNKITIDYPSSTKVVFTDQLGRQAWWEFNAIVGGTQWALVVRLPGVSGQDVYYKVRTAPMNQNYRSDINPTLPVYNGDYDPLGYGYTIFGPHTSLFLQSYGSGAERIDDKYVLTEVVLPDNRSLQFSYNEFGEVAEVTLPTGGKIWYDYAYINMLPSGNSLGGEVIATGQGIGTTRVESIDRAVTARRLFPDGATHETTWTYTYSAVTTSGVTTGDTEVQARSVAGDVLLLRQKHYFLSAQRYLAFNQGNYDGTGYSLWSTGLERRSETLTAAGTALNATEQDWTQRTPVVWTSGYTQEQPENDNRVNQTRNYLDTGGFAKTEIFYDNVNNASANNVTETKEYDFDNTLKRRTVTSYLTTNPDNGNINYSTDDIFLLRLPTQQSVYEGATEKARTVYKYDKYANDGNNATLTDYGPSVTGHDAAYGTGKTTRGNPTAVGQWLNTNGSTLLTYSRYDTLGNIISTKDPRGNVTTLSFADNFGVGDNPDSGAEGAYGPTYALPTLITSPAPNPGEAQQTAKSQYDFSTGLLTGFKDRNGIITKTEYNDPFNRPTRAIKAKGVAGVETQTAMYYAPQSNPYGVTLARNDVLTAKDRDSAGDGVLRSWTVTDGFGRTIESWTRHPQGDVKVSAIYDALSRVKQTSNPYRNSESPLYTTTTYDLAGRVTAVTTPDGATTSTAYDGARMMVTDPAQKRRISETDGLGRLIKIWEIKAQDGDTVSINFPQSGGPLYYGYLTQYTYDALDNLITVAQGAQTRTFAYDSLKRMTSANNPESGLMSYLYDENGNLLEKTDARTAKITSTYDALNRVKSNTYSGTTGEGINAANATPPVYFKYDNQSFPSGPPGPPPSFNRGFATGRLVSVTYGVPTATAGSYFGYDELGRIVRKTQQINGNNYAITAGYNRASAMTSENYPATTHAVNYTYDIAGRLSGFSGTLGDGVSRTYASITQYNAAGLKERESFGMGANGMTTPLYLKLTYNKRHQLVDLRLSSVNDASDFNRGALQFYYSLIGAANQNPLLDDPTNNGNPVRQWSYVPKVAGGFVNTQIDDYAYDALNRVETFTDSQVDENGTLLANMATQNFAYDPYGNRRVTSATGGVSNFNPSYNTANNRIDGLGYDTVGNITTDPATGGTMTYDAENRMVTATNGGGGNYTYDGEGKRVKRITAGQEWWYVYGIGGELLAEYLASAPATVKKEYGYRGGQLLVVWNTDEPLADKKLKWLVMDHLGSTRTEADKSGSLAGITRHDYAPFGEELYAGIRQNGGAGQYGYEPPQSTLRIRFGAKERDNETGLDYFLARYYSSTQGRFASTDPIVMEKRRLGDPQGINLYAYTRNNPLKYIDPDGEKYKGTDGKEVNIVRANQRWVIKSKNATNDLKRLVDLINKSGSKTASAQFAAGLKSATMLNVVIDSDTPRSPDERRDGGAEYGRHEPHDKSGPIHFNDNANKFDGRADPAVDQKGKVIPGAYREATITLFEQKMIEFGSTGQDLYDELVATFGHEMRHDTDPIQVKAGLTGRGSDAIWHPEKNGKAAKYSPQWYRQTILDEIDASRRKVP